MSRLARLDLGEVGGGSGDERREVQVGPIEVGDAVEPAQVQRPGERVDLGIDDPELADEQVEHVLVDVLRDLKADRRAEAPPRELLLQRLRRFSASSSSTSRSSLRVTRKV